MRQAALKRSGPMNTVHEPNNGFPRLLKGDKRTKGGNNVDA